MFKENKQSNANVQVSAAASSPKYAERSKKITFESGLNFQNQLQSQKSNDNLQSNRNHAEHKK